jgi:Protein of unknown function (DUF2975)
MATAGVTNPTSASAPMRIRLLASLGQLACGGSVALSLMIPLLALLSSAWRAELMSGGLTVNGASPLPMTDGTAIGIILVGVPTIMLQCLALLIGFRLFSGFKQGEIFTRRAAQRIAWIGVTIFAMWPLGFMTKFAASMLISGDTQAAMSLRFTIVDLDPSLAAFGLLVILIGKVMEQAAAISEENRQFI